MENPQSNVRIISILVCPDCQRETIERKAADDYFEATKSFGRPKIMYVKKSERCNACNHTLRLKEEKENDDSLIEMAVESFL